MQKIVVVVVVVVVVFGVFAMVVVVLVVVVAASRLCACEVYRHCHCSQCYGHDTVYIYIQVHKSLRVLMCYEHLCVRVFMAPSPLTTDTSAFSSRLVSGVVPTAT